VANAAEVLKRLSEVARDARHTREGVDYLVRTQEVWERRRAEAWRDFELAYTDAILDRWNELELFGIDVSPDLQRKQKLSVAYIQLNLQSADVGESDERLGHLASFEELLARSADSGQPLVILGEAGGGKTTLLCWAACEAVIRQRADDAPDPFPTPRRERLEMGRDRMREPEEAPKLAWWARVPFCPAPARNQGRHRARRIRLARQERGAATRSAAGLAGSDPRRRSRPDPVGRLG
jgi:hypothetical protein